MRSTRPDDIGVSFSYPLPGTPFFERVQEQIGAKSNWTDSDDLCLMFTAAYKDEFYLALRNALHAEVDFWHGDGLSSGGQDWVSLWDKVFALEETSRNSEATSFTQFELRRPGPACSCLKPFNRRDEKRGYMAELLLAHGYFLYEDPKELQIMKPYAPLGILYLCSHLRRKGFDVDVFDTTFSSREALFQHLRSEKPSVLGIYANLLTRKNVVETLKVAREAGWKTIVGGPEPGAYALEYLQAGADFVVFGEGELTVEELLESFRAGSSNGQASIAGIAYLDAEGKMHETPQRTQISDLDSQPWPARQAIDIHRYVKTWRDAHGKGSVNFITARADAFLTLRAAGAATRYLDRLIADAIR